MAFKKKTDEEHRQTLPGLCEDIGITYRRLDYYIRKGYIHCEVPTPGSGFNRPLLAENEIKILRLIVKFVDAGFLPEPAALLARRMVFDQSLITTLPGGIVITLTEELDSGHDEAEDLQGDVQGERITEEV